MTEENLDSALANSEHRLAGFAERCATTAEKADEITGKLRHRWQRRVSGMTPGPTSATDSQERGAAPQ